MSLRISMRVLPCDRPSLLEDSACAGTSELAGCSPRLQFGGLGVLSHHGTLLIEDARLRIQRIGLLLYSLPDALHPLRQRVLCVDAPLARKPLQYSGDPPSSISDCSSTFALEFKQWIATGGPGNLLPRTVVHCQYWYRDAIREIGPVDRLCDSGYFELAPGSGG
jgi:hypothetical protein